MKAYTIISIYLTTFSKRFLISSISNSCLLTMSLISSTTVTGMDDDLDCNVSELLATIPSVDNVKLPNLEKI